MTKERSFAPGLPSFREQDQEFFFGREAESEALRRTVMREATRVTVLFGRSGLGKTSLLQAGLFPRLRRQEVLPVAIRLAYAGERSLVAQVREAILAAAAEAGVEVPALPAGETLWESFHRAGANFWSASNRIVVPLLVFDHRTHQKPDFLIDARAVEHDFRGAKLLAAMHQRHLRTEARQKIRLLHSSVAAAYHHDFAVAVKRAVASGAGADAAADEFLFVRQAQPSG